MSMSRAYYGVFAILMLVVLRLSIGWHFFKEGTAKYRDPHFSSAGFIQQAKGPLAEYFQSYAPAFHQWPRLLAQPQWMGLSANKKDRGADEGEIDSPYQAWQDRIVADWQESVEKFIAAGDLTGEQKATAEKVLETRRQWLADYFQQQSEDIAIYRHELARLQTLRERPETGELPYHDSRTTQKAAETRAKHAPWVKQVRAIERDLVTDLLDVLKESQTILVKAPLPSLDECNRLLMAKVPEEEGESGSEADGETEGSIEGSTANGQPSGEQASSPEEETKESNELVGERRRGGEGERERSVEDSTANGQPSGEPASAQQVARPVVPDTPIEIPEISSDAPYRAYAMAAIRHWRRLHDDFVKRHHMVGQQHKKAGALLQQRVDRLVENLNQGVAEIVKHRRAVEQLQALTDQEQPNQDQIDKKRNETEVRYGRWNGPLLAIGKDQETQRAMTDILSERQREQIKRDSAAVTSAATAALAAPDTRQLDLTVTYWTLGVGICLMLGLFTRLASLAGAVFLLSVIAMQPPWVAGTQPVTKEVIEMVALLALAGTPVGRWGGLDYFFYRMFCACCGNR